MLERLKRDVQVAGTDDIDAQAAALVRARKSSKQVAEVVVGRSFEVGRWVKSGLYLGDKHKYYRDISIFLIN